MKILIATGIYPPEIGGPAQYAKNLVAEFERQGHRVKVLTYRLEHYLPTGLRHLFFFLRTLLALPGTNFILASDTFSVGFPAVLAAKLLNKKIMIRTGGDFLWESYVERTGDLVLLRKFYEKIKTGLAKLSLKEKIIFRLTHWTVNHCSKLVFSTEWQKDIWRMPYDLDLQRTKIIENYYG